MNMSRFLLNLRVRRQLIGLISPSANIEIREFTRFCIDSSWYKISKIPFSTATHSNSKSDETTGVCQPCDETLKHILLDDINEVIINKTTYAGAKTEARKRKMKLTILKDPTTGDVVAFKLITAEHKEKKVKDFQLKAGCSDNDRTVIVNKISRLLKKGHNVVLTINRRLTNGDVEDMAKEENTMEVQAQSLIDTFKHMGYDAKMTAPFIIDIKQKCELSAFPS